jgi:Ca2+-dependent lipid-binding protein
LCATQTNRQQSSNPSLKETLKVVVMDHDTVGKDDFLGEFDVSLGALQPDATVEAWHPLTGKLATGDVHLMLHLTSKPGAPLLAPKLVGKDAGQLFVRVIAGKALAAKDKSGTSDPYCELGVRPATARRREPHHDRTQNARSALGRRAVLSRSARTTRSWLCASSTGTSSPRTSRWAWRRSSSPS